MSNGLPGNGRLLLVLYAIFQMILIATRKNDNSTNDVIDWLLHQGEKVVRVDEDHPIEQLRLKVSQQDKHSFIKIKGITVYLKDVKSIWYRKGDGFFIDFPNKPYQSKAGQVELSKLLDEEWKITREYLYFLLEQKPHLGSYATRSLNKLMVQHLAQQAGLQTPTSFVLNSKEEALSIDFALITKAIAEVAVIPFANETFCSYTSELSPAFLQELPWQFFPALMQQKIEKQYELRVFYLDGKCYSMAIFSQADAQTQIDFRVYNHQNPNRTVPYKLPNAIVERVQSLMQRLELNTGSLDFIVDAKDQYYFLEVNPVGQFGMVSLPCNYYLEKEVANYLANQSKL